MLSYLLHFYLLVHIYFPFQSVYLNHFNIAIRAGNHCAKVLKNNLNIKNTCRVSLYLYNTKEEVDKLIDALKHSEDIFKVVI